MQVNNKLTITRLTKWVPSSTMEVRGANTFPLLNRLPNPNLVTTTILSVSFLFVGFIDIFPFLLGINKVRWRLCCTPSVRKRTSHIFTATESGDSAGDILR